MHLPISPAFSETAGMPVPWLYVELLGIFVTLFVGSVLVFLYYLARRLNFKSVFRLLLFPIVWLSRLAVFGLIAYYAGTLYTEIILKREAEMPDFMFVASYLSPLFIIIAFLGWRDT